MSHLCFKDQSWINISVAFPTTWRFNTQDVIVS